MLKVKNSKAFMIGVMSRYNAIEYLKQAGVDYIMNDPSELVTILRGL